VLVVGGGWGGVLQWVDFGWFPLKGTFSTRASLDYRPIMDAPHVPDTPENFQVKCLTPHGTKWVGVALGKVTHPARVPWMFELHIGACAIRSGVSKYPYLDPGFMLWLRRGRPQPPLKVCTVL
jgi:hypothetical protein